MTENGEHQKLGCYARVYYPTRRPGVWLISPSQPSLVHRGARAPTRERTTCHHLSVHGKHGGSRHPRRHATRARDDGAPHIIRARQVRVGAERAVQAVRPQRCQQRVRAQRRAVVKAVQVDDISLTPRDGQPALIGRYYITERDSARYNTTALLYTAGTGTLCIVVKHFRPIRAGCPSLAPPFPPEKMPHTRLGLYTNILGGFAHTYHRMLGRREFESARQDDRQPREQGTPHPHKVGASFLTS